MKLTLSKESIDEYYELLKDFTPNIKDIIYINIDNIDIFFNSIKNVKNMSLAKTSSLLFDSNSSILSFLNLCYDFKYKTNLHDRLLPFLYDIYQDNRFKELCSLLWEEKFKHLIITQIDKASKESINLIIEKNNFVKTDKAKMLILKRIEEEVKKQINELILK